jgi:type II secretory pathway component GspD/PulD (secretin)
MLKIKQQTGRHHPPFLIRVLPVLLVILVLCSVAGADSISSHRFSMSLRNQTMPEVFQILSEASGFEIIYDDALKNQRVNVRLENATIEKALQSILAHVNSTIIYNRDKTIQIDVYGAGISDTGSSSTSVARKAPRLLPRKNQALSKSPMHQNEMPESETTPNRPLTAQEQYWAAEKAAGNIP